MPTNKWIAHVKAVAKSRGIPYGEAMSIASKSWRGGLAVGGAKKKKTKRTTKKQGGATYASLLNGKTIKISK
jgi:hypothetical protein